MKRVKVIGAGSIGNHLSQAARKKGWEVVLCDNDPQALERTQNSIYPQRYGEWDSAIQLCMADEAPKGGFDYIFIGTPPDSHAVLAEAALDEGPTAILVEKPFGTPDLAGCNTVYEKAKARGIRVFVGYDHAVASSVQYVTDQLAQKSIGDVLTIDTAFREHWQGIFNAHHWLDGPKDTYLGFWQRGGGACGEHSHAIHLWQTLAHACGAGRVVEVGAAIDYVEEDGASFDRMVSMNLRTETGLLGRVVQDVVTQPPLKWAYLQGKDGSIEWQCHPSPYTDTVKVAGAAASDQTFDKTRPDDFIQELGHIESCIDNKVDSPISLERGLETMLVIAAAHKAAETKGVVTIDYSKSYTPDALKTN